MWIVAIVAYLRNMYLYVIIYRVPITKEILHFIYDNNSFISLSVQINISSLFSYYGWQLEHSRNQLRFDLVITLSDILQ